MSQQTQAWFDMTHGNAVLKLSASKKLNPDPSLITFNFIGNAMQPIGLEAEAYHHALESTSNPRDTLCGSFETVSA